MATSNAASTAPASPPVPTRGLKRISQAQWIVISMVVGILLGVLFPDLPAGQKGFQASDLRVLATIFLRMIKSLIVPLLFATLVVGIAGHGDDMKRVGKLAFRSIIYFELVTTLALVVGLLAVNIVKPGVGVNLAAADVSKIANISKTPPTFGEVLEHAVPQSFGEAWMNNEVLQIVVFSIIFAVALARVKGKPKETVLSWCEGISEVMFKYVAIVMSFAPIGIGAAIAVTVGASGLSVLVNLLKLVATLYVALIAFVFLVLLPVALVMRVPIRRFWSVTKEPWLIAFSTASSEAALPRAMQAMEAIGVPRRIVAFVMPTGYSFNLDGSTLYLAVASIFAAQAAGIHMPLRDQIIMMGVLMLTSKGVAAVPRASLVILAGALTQFKLPVEAIAVILGVDAIMDMARTSLNVLGNCLATVVMARWEGVLGTEVLPSIERRAELEGV
jgi:proton glutamate symport protein